MKNGPLTPSPRDHFVSPGDHSLRMLHLADLHLGRSLMDFSLIEDQRHIINQVLTIIDEKSVDAILLSGDIYDKSIPSEEATKLLDYFLAELAQKSVATFVISGNHDSDDRLNFGSSLFETNGIYIAAKYDGRLKKVTMTDAHGEIDIYMLPFIKASQVRHFHPDTEINDYNDAVRTVIESANIDPDKRNIILSHQFVVGGHSVHPEVMSTKTELQSKSNPKLESEPKPGNDSPTETLDPQLAGSEGLSVQSVGLIEKINASIFDVFDYVALGHIHSPQKVAKPQIRYAGSPLKYSLSEVNDAKSMPLITLGNKGEVDIELLPLVPKRDMRHIKGTLKNLLDSYNITDSDDFIYATLTDEEIVNDAMTIFQQYYPNTVKIDYDNSHTKEITAFDTDIVIDQKSFPELLSDFYEKMYGCQISEEELELMKQIGREAGVYYEAD